MAGWRGYLYPIEHEPMPVRPVNRLPAVGPLKDPRPLTGQLQGKTASDLEERFGRALQHAGLFFRFLERVPTAFTIPGQEKVVDFMVENGLNYPVEIDGPIAHRTAAQQGADQVREILLNHVFLQRGMQPIQRVKWWQLDTQASANRVVREMFGGNK